MEDKITDDMLRKAFKSEDKALGLDKLDEKKHCKTYLIEQEKICKDQVVEAVAV